MKPKTSPIWLLPLNDFQKLIKDCKSIKEVLEFFGYKNQGGNPKTLKARIKLENISTQHFITNKNNKFKKSKPLDECLIIDSTYSRTSLKRRLIKENILENKCSGCGIGPEWNGKKLSLQLDHINGVHNDNRLQNLRLLCPNCHSQTDTFSGKTKKLNKPKSFKKKETSIKNRKVQRPTLEILLKEVNSIGYVKTGLKYNVSDNSIRKWIKNYIKNGY